MNGINIKKIIEERKGLTRHSDRTATTTDRKIVSSEHIAKYITIIKHTNVYNNTDEYYIPVETDRYINYDIAKDIYKDVEYYHCEILVDAIVPDMDGNQISIVGDILAVYPGKSPFKNQARELAEVYRAFVGWGNYGKRIDALTIQD